MLSSVRSHFRLKSLVSEVLDVSLPRPQDQLVKLLRECECHLDALMARRRARLSSVYGLLVREGEYRAVPSGSEDKASKERNGFVPLGRCLRADPMPPLLSSSESETTYVLSIVVVYSLTFSTQCRKTASLLIPFRKLRD